jgi:hypothetical protein
MGFLRKCIKYREDKLKLVPVTIGIDFGTSYSKVCFDENRQFNVVVFDATKYKPSVLYYDYKNKILYYENQKNNTDIEKIKYFKYSMIDGSLPKSRYLAGEQLCACPEVLCSIFFIACLIKESKNYITRSFEERKININPDWGITMGVPIDNYDVKHKSLYDKVLHIAIRLSGTLKDDSINIKSLDSFYQEHKNLEIPPFQESPNNTLPELYAECLSFLQDRNEPVGVCAIVDIGGATVDMAVMHKESSNKFSIVSKCIQPLGIEIVINSIRHINAPPKDVRKCLIKNVINDNYIKKDVEHAIFEKIRMMFATVAFEVKEKQSARDALIKQNGLLKIIICGGGASYKWYEDCILANSENLLRTLPVPYSYCLEIMPIEHFLKSSEINNHRLLIAKSLAQRVEGIPVLRNFPWNFQQIEGKEQSTNKDSTLDDISMELYGELN